MRVSRFVAVVVFTAFLAIAVQTSFAECTPTGYFRGPLNLTAALINPETVTGTVDATGCNIGVYFDSGKGSVQYANISGANYFGVVVNGDINVVKVDVVNSTISDIGETPFNGEQHGVAIYYRASGKGSAQGRIAGNDVSRYQKGGIVTNGAGATVHISDNKVTGLGPVDFIAQNGIQVGFGASAQVMDNEVSGNAYTGTSTVSGGIVVVGGPPHLFPYTTGTQIVGNTLRNNDVGIFLSNLADDGGAPIDATNVKAVNNILSNDALMNHYGGFGYQAGISDVGNNDKIINNTISGDGYDPAENPTAYTVPIDADPSFTNRPKVHANTVD